MGLFGSVGKAFTRAVKPVTRALGPVGTALLLPAIPLTGAVLGLASRLETGTHAPTHPEGAPVEGSRVGEPFFNPYFQPQPGGGSYYEPFYQGGGNTPWDSSMESRTYLTPQWQTYPTYSAPASNQRTWEDLISLAPLFL